MAFGGDLLAEFVAASEFFADDFDDVVGVQVGLGKDQCLGDFRSAREDVGGQPVFEGLYDQPNLVFGDDVAVETAWLIHEVLVQLFVDGFF